MKHDNLPLIQALKGRAKPKGDTPLPQFEPPRTFELHHHEIPGLPGKQVGEHITVNLKGKIHSQHEDGRTIMHVASVAHDLKEADGSSNPDDALDKNEIRVRSEESHAP